jgi:hypothetical protein
VGQCPKEMGVTARATPMPMLASVGSLVVCDASEVITVNGSQGMVAYSGRQRVRRRSFYN